MKTLQRAAVDSTRSEATDGAARLSVDVRWLHHTSVETGELFGDMENDGTDPHWSARHPVPGSTRACLLVSQTLLGYHPTTEAGGQDG